MKKVIFLFLLTFPLSAQTTDWKIYQIDYADHMKGWNKAELVVSINQNSDIKFYLNPVDIALDIKYDFPKDCTLRFDFVDETAKIQSLELFAYNNIGTIKKDKKPVLFQLLSEKHSYHVLMKVNSNIIFEFDFDTNKLVDNLHLIYQKEIPFYLLQ